MKYDLIIFDLDGTLIDTRLDLAKAVNIVRENYGLKPLELEKVVSMVGDGIRILVERSLSDLNDQYNIEDAIKLFNQAYSEHMLDNTKPYPGIVKVLRELDDRGIKMSIFTNKSGMFTREILKGLNLYRFFDLIIAGDEFKRKPDPEGIYYILKTLDIQKDRSLMVGDGKNDILVAKNAGIDSMYVSYGYSGKNLQIEEKPDYIVVSPEDILSIF